MHLLNKNGIKRLVVITNPVSDILPLRSIKLWQRCKNGSEYYPFTLLGSPVASPILSLALATRGKRNSIIKTTFFPWFTEKIFRNRRFRFY